MISSEYSAWFQGKEFSSDWTSGHFPNWSTIFAPLKNQSIKVLEIGSYEGFSALFFLNYFSRSTIVCVDAWNLRTPEPAIVKLGPSVAADYPLAEGRFDRNLNVFSDRLIKLNAFSADALGELGVKGERFDMVYVDGSHRRLDAYRDCTLSWPLLNPGGVMLMDDYEFGSRLPDELKPKQGIDAFLSNVAGCCDEIHRSYQIAILKR
jgi:predicted O-methyltransferase YrrM